LEWILGKYNGKVWTEFMWFRIGPVAGCCEDGNELSASTNGGEFDYLSDW